MSSSRPDVLPLLLRASAGVAERVNTTVTEAGHPGLRPVHGLVFLECAAGGSTIQQVAEAIGVTKQSAAAIVDHLVGSGYLHRSSHPTDGRAQLLTLTPTARRATEVATAASVEEWRRLTDRFGDEVAAALGEALELLGHDSAPRPVW